MAFAGIHIPDFLLQAVVRGESVFPSPLTGEVVPCPLAGDVFPRLLAGDALRGRALALVDGDPPLCRVVATSEAALRTGIEIGMAKAQVEQFRGVEIRRRSPEQEKNAHAALLDLGGSFSPRVEDTAPETILLDLAGLDALFGGAESMAQRLAQGALDVCGLAAHVAVAQNPDAALHAARGFEGVTVIAEGEEAARLGPLPIAALGASAEALETFDRWGVRNCAALAALPVLELSERLGAEGVRLHQWARGAGQRSLRLAEPASCFEEELALEYDVEELEPLSFLLSRMLESLCARLAARSLAASALRLRLTLAPAQGRTTSGTHEKHLSLPVPLRNAKLLLNLLRLQLQGDPPGAPVRGIFLAAEPARPRATQGGFFIPARPDPEKLELTLAKLAHLVGESRVGSPQLADTHRPDAFHMQRFVAATMEKRQKPQGPRRNSPGHPELQQKPAAEPDQSSAVVRTKQRPQVAHKTGRPELQQKLSPTSECENTAQKMPRIGFRMFRPARAARVEMRAGRPVSVFFHGLRGTVVTASGPWRCSGEWWEKDAWQQDEWELEIEFSPQSSRRDAKQQEMRRGLYRFAYDDIRREWLVRGVFD